MRPHAVRPCRRSADEGRKVLKKRVISCVDGGGGHRADGLPFRISFNVSSTRKPLSIHWRKIPTRFHHGPKKRNPAKLQARARVLPCATKLQWGTQGRVLQASLGRGGRTALEALGGKIQKCEGHALPLRLGECFSAYSLDFRRPPSACPVHGEISLGFRSDGREASTNSPKNGWIDFHRCHVNSFRSRPYERADSLVRGREEAVGGTWSRRAASQNQVTGPNINTEPRSPRCQEPRLERGALLTLPPASRRSLRGKEL